MTTEVVEIDWVPIIELAGKVAREVAVRWRVVGADDVKQEILLHMMEEKHLIAKYQGDEELLRKISWTAGKRYAAKERAHYDLMDDQYYYTPDEARLALRSFLYTDEELGDLLGKEDDLLRCRVTDNLVSARIDATDALNRLSKDYKEVAMRVFVYGLPPRDEAERRKSYRAVDALALQMNRAIRTRKKVENDG
ncbi:hypothetical protein [Streptomyces decoyicus]